jgi:hypothetical protein
MRLKTSIVAASFALLAAGACLAQTTAPAPPAPPQPPPAAKFAEHKAKLLERIDQHVAAMSALRSCVSAAADRDAVRTCEEQNRAAMQAQRPHH